MADGGMPGVRIPAKLQPLVTLRRRYKVLHGGRGSGKSHTVAQVLVALAAKVRIRVLCVREVQKSIRDSVHHLLSRYIEALGLSELYDVQRTTIVCRATGSEFMFAGMQDHTADTIKSFEDCDICWVEEARTLSRRSLEILTPTIRNPGSEIWFTLNPELPDDAVYVEFIACEPRDDTWCVQVNWRDNPWFPDELRSDMERQRRVNHDLYLHIWEGALRSAAGLMFKRAWAQWYDAAPPREALNVYLASDFATTPDGGDWTEHGVFGIDSDGTTYVLDWWYGQVDTGTGIDEALNLCSRWKPRMWFDEAGVIRRALDPAIGKRMAERGIWVLRESTSTAGRKDERAAGFAARMQHGNVRLPRGPDWAVRLLNQLCAFTGEEGRQDDAVDVCAVFSRGLDEVDAAWKPPQKAKREAPKPFTEAWLDAADWQDAQERKRRAEYYR